MDDSTDQIVRVESGGDPTARNPNSSAAGPGQFIDSTWLDVLKQHRPDLAGKMSDADLLALKNNPQLASQPQNVQLAHDMTAAYAADNQAVLSKNGITPTPGNTYLAHFAGPQSAVSVLQADPNTSIEKILSPAAIKANPFLRGMTAQGLQAWAAKKMGTPAPAPGPQQPSQQPIFAQAPQGAPGAPLSLAPLAGQPAQQQPGLLQTAGNALGGLGGIQAPQAQLPAARPPIFAPLQQQPINLAGLQNMLARGPLAQNPLYAGGQAAIGLGQQAPIFVNRG